MSQSAEGYCDQQNREHGNWPALPAFLTFACYKRKRQENNDSDGGTYQQNRCLGRRGQEREQRIQPQKEEVRTRGRLNNGRVRVAARTEGAKIDRARSDREKNETGEKDVLPNSTRHERHTLRTRQLVILLQVRGAADDAAWHWPLADS